MLFSSDDIVNFPQSPGVYKFFDKNKVLIYVGKAKNLKKRVSSYFNKTSKSNKTLNLVKKIRYIDFIVVNTENEAFLLENNLIKKDKPFYNILLKDSKTYPYIILTNDEFPKILISEHLDNNCDYYFGPFSDRDIMNNIIDIIKKLCQLRICKHSISIDDVEKNKYKVCLEYHLGNCCGICEKKIPIEDYKDRVLLAKDILKGNLNTIKNDTKKKMLIHSKLREYKLAQKYKDKLDAIERYNSKSIISNPVSKNFDVFYCEEDEDNVFICYMIIKNGMIIFVKNDVLCKSDYIS